MTSLDSIDARAVVRVTAARSRGRQIVIKLEAGGRIIRFREKGRRQWHVATVEQCFWAAVRNTAAELKRQRAERRAARRRGRA